MNPQPTIFISSIISEFFDLRGALSYFLGKSGFRVLMSESPDFGADCGIDSLENCKNQIAKSDYYLIIIGNKPGTKFTINGIETTVTFEEFRYFTELVKKGRNLNLIAFVRNETWKYFNEKNDKIDPLQVLLIEELINNTLENKIIGRWRHEFNSFSDIITVLETNQNGLFLDSTRKKVLYRAYIKREITEILRCFLNKKGPNGEIVSVLQIVPLPVLTGLDFIRTSKIDRDIAIKIHIFLMIISKQTTLFRKINRVFNYIAQGEFAVFDSTEEKYILPEFIKLTIQTLEILEKIFDNRDRTTLFDKLLNLGEDNFCINSFQYGLVKKLHDELKIVVSKLVNLVNCFNNNWHDLEKKPDEFYLYRGNAGEDINDEEIALYAENYFK